MKPLSNETSQKIYDYMQVFAFGIPFDSKTQL